ncbi:efflux transporter outer membrane subunit [Novosphingopyxis sp.]|uniref:efflux transporter outer membrane subunit n=1 Tax=Novosphingopyxis sp. TaxID=2709690 RepID=UPI003B59F2CA
MIRSPKKLFAGAAILMVSACTVGPDYVPPVNLLPPAFDAGGISGAVQDRWWTEFGDPALDQLVNQALQANLDIAVSDARILQARAVRDIAGGGALPSVGANGSLTQTRVSENGAQLASIPDTFSPRTEYTDYKGSFDASWEIDLFGYNRRQVEAATARLGSAEEDRRATVIRIAAEVARNYADLRANERRIEIALATIKSNRETLALVRQRIDAGEEAEIAGGRAKSALRQAEAALPPLSASRKQSLYALDVLLSQQPGFTEDMLATVEGPSLSVPIIPTGLPADLLRRRPDVRSAERDLAAATADVGVAVADLYPRISITGEIGLEALGPGDLIKSASLFWQGGPSISLPVFDAGRRRASVRQQRAEADESLALYKKAVLQALSDVEGALIQFRRSQERASALGAARAELALTLDLTRQRYDVGETDLLDVLDVERQVTTLDDQLAQANAQTLINAISLDKALGGGWQTFETGHAERRS